MFASRASDDVTDSRQHEQQDYEERDREDRRRDVQGLTETHSAAHAARCTARHGVGSHPVPVVLVGGCSIPLV
jgi:hypothetical protein